jgi:hypothetical protein
MTLLPKQGVLVGTSAFRLDRLAVYLASDGPVQYFTQGLHVAYTGLRARQWIDKILGEILGVHTPPDVMYCSHEQYVAEACAVPANRARADQHYLSAMQQIGMFWGGLIGPRRVYQRGIICRKKCRLKELLA